MTFTQKLLFILFPLSLTALPAYAFEDMAMDMEMIDMGEEEDTGLTNPHQAPGLKSGGSGSRSTGLHGLIRPQYGAEYYDVWCGTQATTMRASVPHFYVDLGGMNLDISRELHGLLFSQPHITLPGFVHQCYRIALQWAVPDPICLGMRGFNHMPDMAKRECGIWFEGMKGHSKR